jgi:hypothetical protein
MNKNKEKMCRGAMDFINDLGGACIVIDDAVKYY